MEVAKTIQTVRGLLKAAREQGKCIGLVPTMGALHAGHISLIEAAAEQTDFVVVTIFVNPTQFDPGEDLEKYPRPLDADLEICKKHGVDLVFVPYADEMYPAKNLTWVNVEELTAGLCGRSRPDHFRGVATVCAKLFNIVGADIAFFGLKDAQQTVVIKRMVADLNMPMQIVVCPTVRESDGLAVSSRNQYLTEQQRKDAACLYESLEKCGRMIEAGERDVETIAAAMRNILSKPASAEIEYVGIVNAETLQGLERAAGKVLAAVAVRIGRARLIDNIVVDAGE